MLIHNNLDMQSKRTPERVVTHLGFGKLSLFSPPALEINCATVIPLYLSYTTALQALWALFISSTNSWLGINFLFSRSVNSFKFSFLGGTLSETFFPMLIKMKQKNYCTAVRFSCWSAITCPPILLKFVKFK